MGSTTGKAGCLVGGPNQAELQTKLPGCAKSSAGQGHWLGSINGQRYLLCSLLGYHHLQESGPLRPEHWMLQPHSFSPSLLIPQISPVITVGRDTNGSPGKCPTLQEAGCVP